jgi:hypothetical protein
LRPDLTQLPPTADARRVMRRIRPRRLLIALFAIVVVAFLAVKLVPGPKKPPVEIASRGADRALARHPLEAELKHLFQTSNGHWQVIGPATLADVSRCHPTGAPRPTGSAITASYVFARWLELRMQSVIYATDSLAQRALATYGPRNLACLARVAVDAFRRRGANAGAPYALSVTRLNVEDGGEASHFAIPLRYRAQVYRWNLDSTALRRGRMILAAETAVAGPFARGDQGLASDLAKAVGTGH